MMEYRHMTCPICGIHYAIEEAVMAYKSRTANEKERGWHCPNGDSLHYKENDLDKMRQERDRLKQEQARLIEERDIEARRAVLAEARERRLKKRASAGSCPCCQRSFANMARHMKTQHPDFIKEQGAKIVPLKRAG